MQNNPVNYTDPSGHSLVLTTMGGGRKQSPLVSAFIAGIKNVTSNLVAPIRTAAQFASVSIRVATATVSYKMVKAHPHHYTDAQTAKVRGEYIAAVGEKASFHLREAANLVRNWTKSLHQTMRHVCDPKTTKAGDKGRSPKPVSYGVNLGGVASWDGTSGPSSRYQSNASGQATTKKRNSSRISDSHYGVSLGGVASWNGTSSTSNQPQTNTKKGHTFDPSRIRNMTPVDIQALAILAGLLVGLSGGGPVGGFVTHGAVSSGLTSYSHGDKPINVAVNTAGGALQGYFVGKPVKGLLTAARGVLARARGTLKQSPQSSKVYGQQPANTVDDVGGANRTITSLDRLSPKDIQSMSLDDIRRSVPTDKGWTIHEHNGRIHIYDGSSPHPIIRIDPPDAVTKYDHIHFYDKSNNSLDVNGNIVSKKSPDAHIPWLGK